MGILNSTEFGCRLLSWRGMLLFLVVEVEAEFGVLAGAGDADGDFSAGAVLLEEAVGGLEECAEDAADNLRDGGVEFGFTGEVECAAVGAVLAGQLDGGAGDGVGEGGEGDDAGGHGEAALHGGAGGVGVGCLHLFGMALAAQAEIGDLVLDVGAGEADLVEVEGALDLEALVHGDGAGRDVQSGIHGERTDEQRGGLVAGEMKEVFDACALHGDVEGDVMAVADEVAGCRRVGCGDADDLALSGEVRAAEDGVDGLEPGVAVGAVDSGVEVGVQRHGVAEVGEAEVGGVGVAVDDDVAQGALVLAGGRENAADAFEGAEVGVVEGVLALDGILAGIGNLPGAEVAGGVNGADGAGVGEVGYEVHHAAAAEGRSLAVSESEAGNGEVERQLAGLVGLEDEVGVGALDLVDGEGEDRRGVGLDIGGGVAEVGFGRNVNIEAFELNQADVKGFAG